MQKRSAEEVEQLVRGYEESKLGRQEYCRRVGIPVTTLDYYRQRESRRKTGTGERAVARLVKVNVETPAEQEQSVFTVVLRNGRRIESAWTYAEVELARLIRIVEAV